MRGVSITGAFKFHEKMMMEEEWLISVLCKFRLVGAWIKRREIVNGARRIKSEKLREDQCREGCTRCLKNKSVG